mmetsp:Transcript_22482/g.45062  ORF Transcript_22482/g.45062 Transcript_22482/m.45062 type:complete len:537 (+) Transcript_22482:169-1779(+)
MSNMGSGGIESENSGCRNEVSENLPHKIECNNRDDLHVNSGVDSRRNDCPNTMNQMGDRGYDENVNGHLGVGQYSFSDSDLYHPSHNHVHSHSHSRHGHGHSGNHQVPEISPATSVESHRSGNGSIGNGYVDSRSGSHYNPHQPPSMWPTHQQSFRNSPINDPSSHGSGGHGALSPPDGRHIPTWSPQTKMSAGPDGMGNTPHMITPLNDPYYTKQGSAGGRSGHGGGGPVPPSTPCGPQGPGYGNPYGTPCASGPPPQSYGGGWNQPAYTPPPPYGMTQMYPPQQQPVHQGRAPFGSPQPGGRQGPGGPVGGRPAGGVTEPFPDKLYRLIEDAQAEGKSEIISFFSHGRAFAIHDPDRFCEEIMPRFFRQTKLASFQRQLNLYGFRRISRGPDSGGYYHAMFVRGRPDLCPYMRRTKVRGQHGGTLNRDDPNFYAMNPVDETYYPSYGGGTTNGQQSMSTPYHMAQYPSPSPQYMPVQDHMGPAAWRSPPAGHGMGSYPSNMGENDQRIIMTPQGIRGPPPMHQQHLYDPNSSYQ